MTNKNKDLKLPSRSYWEGFKARNEALWDKVKNNTFVNMVFPVKEVSEGTTEAILPLIVPGGNIVTATARGVDMPLGSTAKSVLMELDFPKYIKNVQLVRKLGRPKVPVPTGRNTFKKHIKELETSIDNVNGGVPKGLPVFPNNASMSLHMLDLPVKSFSPELSKHLYKMSAPANWELGYQYLKKTGTPIIPTANGYIIHQNGLWIEEPVENILKVTGLKKMEVL